MPKIKDVGELGLIKRIAKNIWLDKTVVRGIGDDTAVIKWTAGKYLLFTCDMLVEGTHFTRKGARPFQIGRKALARNISDIAAMGGVPKYALVSVGLDPELPVSFADGIFKGMNELAMRFKINIVGGDTTRSKKLAIDISLIGEVEHKNLVLRCGARPGDAIFITGSVGGSIKGKHLDFIPRLEEARALVKKYKVNAMIDVSDGLLLDLWRILDASKTGAVICEDLIPVSADASSFRKAITDGEDFELLFTMPEREALRLMNSHGSKIRTPVSLIGQVVDAKRGYVLVKKNRKIERLKPEGFLHF